MPPAPIVPRRVLQVVSQYGALSEGFVADAVNSVDSGDWQSWVLARDVMNRDVFPLPPDDRIIRWDLPPATLWRRRSPLVHQRVAGALTRPHLEAVRPTIVHSHFGWNLPDVVAPAAALGIPLVATFHASDVTVYPGLGRFERLLPAWRRHGNRYGSVFPHVAAGIVVSEHIAGVVRALGFQAPLEVIPAGIDLDRFPYRAPRTSGSEVRLLFIGRLVERKGLDVLLRALAEPALGTEVALDVVGHGPEREDLTRLAHELGVGDRVVFHGALPRPEVIGLLERDDVLVMSSRTLASGEIEGSPVVTKEAQAIGLPVVATDNGGTRETLPPEHRHLVVAEEDPEALAAAIAGLVARRADWPDHTAMARRFVEDNFGWAQLAKRTIALYDRTVALSRADQPGRPR